MTIIKPFNGVLYNRKVVGALSKVITPPYDVINPKQQQGYYKSHPHNFIRLDLGKKSDKDSSSNNRYTRAKKYFEQWIKEGVFAIDDVPSVYIYSQGYEIEGVKKTRFGFISLAKLEVDRTKGFLPHERTFSGPKMDRLQLMKEVKANLSPIFSILFDENKKIIRILKDYADKNKPVIDVRFEGTENKIWRMSDKGLIAKLSSAVRRKKALIADGHHRYEVALEYRQAMRDSEKKTEGASRPYDYVMMYFAPSDVNGLTVLPTHRMVEGISGGMFKKKMGKAEEYFDIINAGGRKEMLSLMKSKGKHTIGVYMGGRDYYCLRLKQDDACGVIKAKHSIYWKNLDVVILHNLIFEKIFGMKGEAAEDSISFTRDPGVAFDWVKEADNRAAFFLNPPALEDVNNIVRSRERMPHKTTYFYPKPPSGLIVNKLEI